MCGVGDPVTKHVCLKKKLKIPIPNTDRGIQWDEAMNRVIFYPGPLLVPSHSFSSRTGKGKNRVVDFIHIKLH